MKTSIPFFFLLSLILIFTSCEEENETGTIHLYGTVNTDDIAYVQRMYADSIKVIDTLDLAGGQIEANLMATSSDEIYVVTFPGDRSLRFIAHAGEEIKIDVELTETFLFYDLEGNESSRRLAEQQRTMGNTIRTLDSLDAMNLQYRDSTNFGEISQSLQQVFQETMIAHRNQLRAMAIEDSTDLSNIFIFYHQVGNTSVLSPQADLELFYMVDNGVYSRYPENSMAQIFHKNVQELKAQVERSQAVEQSRLQIKKGNLAPSIALNDPFGEERSLKDLRGNIVLIDFWAAWCGPCRRNNPHLVEMYQKYKDADFEIFSVSLDGVPNQSVPLEKWREAIQQDRLTWPNHVSELKGWNSQVVTDYGISGIPFTVLIDREGYIIGTNLMGSSLEEQLKIYLGY